MLPVVIGTILAFALPFQPGVLKVADYVSQSFSITGHSNSRGGIVAASDPCGELTDAEVNAMSHYQDAITNHDKSDEARWGSALLDAELKPLALIPSAAAKADCYGGSVISIQGPQVVYYLMVDGDVQVAWQYARKLAHIWNKYRRYATSTARDDYDEFPSDITHAIHYGCNPTSPGGDCPWPPPSHIVDATIATLLR